MGDVLRDPVPSNITRPCSSSQPSRESQADAVSVEAPSWPSTLPPAPWPFPGVQAFHSESDVALSQWCNDTFSRQHPLTAADYDGAYTPGGACSMPAGLLEALESGSRELTVAVVGGSMTHGSGCYEGPNRWLPTCRAQDKKCYSKRCAWPSRMKDRLQLSYPSSRLTVRNMAQPAWSYARWLEAGVIDTLVQSDVLIIDLQVNSQVISQQQCCCSRSPAACHHSIMPFRLNMHTHDKVWSRRSKKIL